MLTLEDLIPCDDIAGLAVNDVNLGDEAVYFLIFIIHTLKVTRKSQKSKKNFQLIFCPILSLLNRIMQQKN